MKRIFIFRHGQTDWNLKGILQGGGIYIPLNAQGAQQAHDLGNKLKAEGIEHIYSSDLQRADQTAQIVAGYVQCPVKHMQELREVHAGFMQGKKKIEYIDHPVFLHWASADEMHDHVGFEGGETKRQVKERLNKALKTIFETSNHSTIAISSHGMVTTQLLCVLLNDPNIVVEKLGNAEYVVLVKDLHGWTMLPAAIKHKIVQVRLYEKNIFNYFGCIHGNYKLIRWTGKQYPQESVRV